MDDACPMRLVERLGDLDWRFQRIVHVERAPLRPRREGFAFQILEHLADGEPEIRSRLKVWRDMLSAATTQARQTPSLHQNFPQITLELLFWSWGCQMNASRPIVERRAPDRPSNGTTRACPKCHTHQMDFNERYRLPKRNGKFRTIPAWVCDSAACGYRCAARSEDDLNWAARVLRVISKNLRAKASRGFSKSLARNVR
jgi:hypothetical protein